MSVLKYSPDVCCHKKKQKKTKSSCGRANCGWLICLLVHNRIWKQVLCPSVVLLWQPFFFGPSPWGQLVAARQTRWSSPACYGRPLLPPLSLPLLLLRSSLHPVSEPRGLYFSYAARGHDSLPPATVMTTGLAAHMAYGVSAFWIPGRAEVMNVAIVSSRVQAVISWTDELMNQLFYVLTTSTGRTTVYMLLLSKSLDNRVIK